MCYTYITSEYRLQQQRVSGKLLEYLVYYLLLCLYVVCTDTYYTVYHVCVLLVVQLLLNSTW